jgi:hypothetical protein
MHVGFYTFCASFADSAWGRGSRARVARRARREGDDDDDRASETLVARLRARRVACGSRDASRARDWARSVRCAAAVRWRRARPRGRAFQ